ncbi:MAG: zinc finger domain-containing protein [Ilumatobacteraceae bacterium]
MCSRCGGRGVIDDNQGFFSFSTPCTACGGRGVTIEQPCPTCRGGGVEKRQREVQADSRRCGRRAEDPAEGPRRPGATVAWPAT